MTCYLTSRIDMEFFKTKLGKIIMRIALALVFVSAFIGGCSYMNNKLGLEDDHMLEEAVEHQIKENTGIDVDLSPESPE